MGFKPLNAICSFLLAPQPARSPCLGLFATGVDCVAARPGADRLELRIIAREFRLANKFHQRKPTASNSQNSSCGAMPCSSVGRSMSTTTTWPVLAQRRAQPPEERIGLLDLVVHVDHEDAVEAVLGQPRVVGRAETDRDVVEPFARSHALRQPVARLASMSSASTRPRAPTRSASRTV
jgi:hypothetical protein